MPLQPVNTSLKTTEKREYICLTEPSSSNTNSNENNNFLKKKNIFESLPSPSANNTSIKSKLIERNLNKSYSSCRELTNDPKSKEKEEQFSDFIKSENFVDSVPINSENLFSHKNLNNDNFSVDNNEFKQESTNFDNIVKRTDERKVSPLIIEKSFNNTNLVTNQLDNNLIPENTKKLGNSVNNNIPKKLDSSLIPNIPKKLDSSLIPNIPKKLDSSLIPNFPKKLDSSLIPNFPKKLDSSLIPNFPKKLDSSLISNAIKKLDGSLASNVSKKHDSSITANVPKKLDNSLIPSTMKMFMNTNIHENYSKRLSNCSEFENDSQRLNENSMKFHSSTLPNSSILEVENKDIFRNSNNIIDNYLNKGNSIYTSDTKSESRLDSRLDNRETRLDSKLDSRSDSRLDNRNSRLDSRLDIKVDKSDTVLIDMTILKSLDQPYHEDEFPPDSFCEAFFGVSLQNNKPKTINDSEPYIASCRHQKCGIFPAYKPEIIFRVPFNDSKKLDLNSTIASLCFPKGIKICWNETEDEKDLITLKNFLIINTNAFGIRYYIMTYHYYEKIELSTFKTLYDADPVNEYLNLEKENIELENIELDINDSEKTIQEKQDKQKVIEARMTEKLNFCSTIVNKDIYIPKCICLLSKYPYGNQMEKCLETLLKMSYIDKYNSNDVNKLILHLIKEIPIPPPNTKLQFNIPLQANPIEISGPIYKKLPLLNFNLKIIFDLFSIENIILIHHLMLCEQKILFISNHFYLLTEVIEAFIALFYPLQWTYPYIPILSDELVKYLQTPLPFIMGIDKFMMDLVKEYLNIEEDDVFLVYIDTNVKENKIEKFSIEKSKKKKKLMENVPAFPLKIHKYLTKSLKEIKSIIDKKKSYLNLDKIDKAIRLTFTTSMVKMFGDYTNFLSFLDNVPIFNKEIFFKTKSHGEIEFYDRVLESQNFNFFLQLDSKKTTPFFYIQCHIYSKNKGKKDKNRNSRVGSCKKKINDSTDMSNLKSGFLEDSDEGNDKTSFYENKMKEYLISYAIKSYLPLNLNELNNIPPNKIILVKQPNFNIAYPLSKTFKRYIIEDTNKEEDLNSSKDTSNSSIKYASCYNEDMKDLISSKKFEENRKFTIINRSRGSNLVRVNDKKQMEEIENILNDYMRQIFTSKPLSENDRKIIFNYIKIREARSYLAKIIFQSKFKEQISVCLGEKSFEDLSIIVFNTLLEINDKYDFDDGRLFTKSCFFYYKICHGQANKYLFTEFTNKNGKIKFSVWQNTNFWSKWFELEIKENREMNTTIENHNLYVDKWRSIQNAMTDLQLDKTLIHKCEMESFANMKIELKQVNEK